MQSQVSQATVEINEKWLPGVRTLDQMHSQHSIMERSVLNHSLCTTPECRQDKATDYEKAKQRLGTGFRQFQALITTPEEKNLLTYLNQLVTAYDEAAEKAISVSSSGASQQAIQEALAHSRETYDAAYTVGDQVIDMYNKGAGNATLRVIATNDSAKTLVSSAIALTLAVGIFATMLLTTLIAKPLVEASSILKRVSEKDLTQTFELNSADEVGEMAVSLNTTIKTIREILGQIASGADQLAQSAESIANTTQQSSESAQSQSDQTAQVATAMHEMSATVVEVSSNSQQAADAAREASETAREGGKVANETLLAMRSIATSNASVGAQIGQLGKSSEHIGAIAAVIDDIADQTNLLALNAAIEAARAGEQGRGFAVVADEVRKLAERTTTATKEIAGMIESIQKDAREAVTAVQNGTREVELGVSKTESTGKALDQIIKMASKVGDMVTQIATAATEQSATAELVNSNVANIAEMTSQSSLNAGENAKACTNLSNLAFNLQSLVGNFKINTTDQRHPTDSHRGNHTQGLRKSSYSSANVQ